MARQEKCHEKGKDAECTYSNEIGTIKLEDHVTRCLINVCQRKSSMENYKRTNAPMVVRRSDTRTPSKPPLKTNIPTESWEQTAHDRTKWRGLIRRSASEYE